MEGIRFIERAQVNPVDKEQLLKDLEPVRNLFTKSIVARFHLAAGSVLEENMLALKKPGTGLPPERMPGLIGRRLRVDVFEDSQIKENDLE